MIDLNPMEKSYAGKGLVITATNQDTRLPSSCVSKVCKTVLTSGGCASSKTCAEVLDLLVIWGEAQILEALMFKHR